MPGGIEPVTSETDGAGRRRETMWPPRFRTPQPSSAFFADRVSESRLQLRDERRVGVGLCVDVWSVFASCGLGGNVRASFS